MADEEAQRDPGADSSVAARLIAALEDDAELVDHGSFAIDVTRALDKFEQFLLAEPRAYVLRLAEAGLLAGASALRFDVDGPMLCVSFDRSGEPVVLPEGVLARLSSALLGGEFAQTGLPRAVFVQLAVAVVSALRLEPTYLAIESIAADRRGARWVYASSESLERQGRLESIADADPGTRVYVREAADWDRAVDGAIGQRTEQELLRLHCRFASTPIFLDGRRISQQPMLARTQLRRDLVDEAGVVIGEAGFAASSDAPVVHFLDHGLIIESLSAEVWDRGFVAAVDVTLPRDLSQATLTRGPELDAVMRWIDGVHAELRAQRRADLVLAQRRVPARRRLSGGTKRAFGGVLIVGAAALVAALPTSLSLVATFAVAYVVIGALLVGGGLLFRGRGRRRP